MRVRQNVRAPFLCSGFFSAIARRRRSVTKQSGAGAPFTSIDRAIERQFIRAMTIRAAQLDELKGRRPYFVVSRGGRKVGEGFDIPTHPRTP
jgi:hypothetical protein